MRKMSESSCEMKKRDKETTYRIMSSVKSKDTEPERILGSAMWRLGLRYRKQYKLKGKPDFVFVSARIAVFCDGDFWHGGNWRLRGFDSLKEELASYNDFWAEKIERNVQRDRQVNKDLKKEGWMVIRFWESDVRKSPEDCAIKIFEEYEKAINNK